jgi:hypothetical protein
MSVVILADVSGSMDRIEGSRRRIDLLQDILRQVLPDVPGARVIAFGSVPTEIHGFEPHTLGLPPPAGGTALHLALALVTKGPRPTRIVVVSDGRPDDPQAALTAARALAPLVIDALYAGPDGDSTALGFMRALSFAGGRPGVSGARSLANSQLADELRLRLTGPAR